MTTHAPAHEATEFRPADRAGHSAGAGHPRPANAPADGYVRAVNSGWTKTLAKKLGLPRPAILRRDAPGEPLTVGPVVLIASPSSSADSDAVASHMLGWDLQVTRHADEDAKLGAIVCVLTGVEDVTELSAPVLEIGRHLRRLAPCGRVVLIARAPGAHDAPRLAAARTAIDGLLRSLAKELRAGATGNAVLLGDGVEAASPSAMAALRFFLSARSAYVDGQLLRVDGPGTGPAGAARPLAGKVAVVTGAARGIGAAISRQLALDGARLVVIDVPAAGQQLAQTANKVQGMSLQLDVTAEDAGQRIAAAVNKRFGPIDIFIHNAGITRDKLLANMKADKWDAVIAVNIAAQLRINEQLLAEGALAPDCRIVCLASTSGIAGNRGQSNYGASKAGVIGMVRSTGPLLPAGGTINAVAPGFIETDMTAAIPRVQRELFRRLSSLQQGGQPRDVAAAIAFLASPAAGGVQGQVLRVCGQNLVGQ